MEGIFLRKVKLLRDFAKINWEFVEPLSLLRRQLPIKWGAYIRLPPGGEGVTAGDGRGDATQFRHFALCVLHFALHRQIII